MLLVMPESEHDKNAGNRVPQKDRGWVEGIVHHEISHVNDNKIKGTEHTMKMATAMDLGIANENCVIFISYIRD